jgi:hypothetical protein
MTYTTLPPELRARISLVTLADVLRALRRDRYDYGAAWRGVLRQVRRYADELRWLRARQDVRP